MLRTASALALMVTLVGAPLSAVADDSRLNALEQRLMLLEDRLKESNAVIEAQREMLRDTPAPVSEGPGGLDGFFKDLEIGGHVTSTYIYNFNNPAFNLANFGGATTAPTPAAIAAQPLCQFNCNHNEFSLDAIKLEIGKSADSPGEAGFQLDILWGQNANILGGAGSGVASDFTNTYFQEAYVSYNYNGTLIKFGKWETLLGWELLDSNANYQVTPGLLFTWAIPLFHTGLIASGNLTEEIGWQLGVTNGFNNSIDTDDNKAVLSQLSYASGPLFASISGYHGNLGETRGSISEGVGGALPAGTFVGDNRPKTQIYDLVVSYEPNDTWITWLNIDYGRTHFENINPNTGAGETSSTAEWKGVSAGFNYNLSERMNFSLRGEYFMDDDNSRFGFAQPAAGILEDTDAWSATATLGYQLTDNLRTRFEVRHDRIDTDPVDTDQFLENDRGVFASEDSATYGILEVQYTFD